MTHSLVEKLDWEWGDNAIFYVEQRFLDQIDIVNSEEKLNNIFCLVTNITDQGHNFCHRHHND